MLMGNEAYGNNTLLTNVPKDFLKAIALEVRKNSKIPQLPLEISLDNVLLKDPIVNAVAKVYVLVCPLNTATLAPLCNLPAPNLPDPQITPMHLE